MELGVLSLLPIVVFFVLVFTTKRMVTSFVVGILLASILTSGTGFVSAFLGFIQSAFMGGTLGYLFLLLALFGILIMLLDESGAALGFANWVSKFANTKRKALLLSLVVGVATFVDDYLHEMAVGSAMKPVTDKFRISRSKLAVLNNATAATVCVMIPLSTWGAFYAGLYESTEICEAGQGLSAYISSLPYMFFPIIMILLTVLLCLGVLPDIGALKKSERLAQTEGILCAAEINNDHKEIRCSEDDAQAEHTNANPIPFILSIVVIVAITMILGDVCIGCCGVNSQTKRIFGISSWRSSSQMRDSIACAAERRFSRRISPCRIVSFCSSASRFLSVSIRSDANSISSSRCSESAR